MNTIELNDLEIKVDHLLQTIERLRTENKSLHIQMAGLARERSLLQESKARAATEVKRIIRQLKEELE